MKRTALIEWSGRSEIFHFTVEITFAIADQKRARNVKMTIKTSDTALLFIKLVESFAIVILDVLIDYEFPLTHCSLPQTTPLLVASSQTTP